MLRMFVAAAVVASAGAAHAADCETTIRLHGYLRWSHSQCGFKEHPAVLEAARTCYREVANAERDRLLADGPRFAVEEAKAQGGTEAWCAGVLRQSPSLIVR